LPCTVKLSHVRRTIARLLSCLMLLLLTSCVNQPQKPAVHIFTLDQAEKTTVDLLKVISSMGYSVQISGEVMPEGIDKPTMIVPRLIRSAEIVDEIQHASKLSGVGDLEVAVQSAGSHFYNTDHIGVYIPGTSEETVHQEDKAALLVSYKTFLGDCDSEDVELNLFDGYLSLMRVFSWDDQLKTETIENLPGTWMLEDGQLIVELDNVSEAKYEMNEFEEEIDTGVYSGMQLRRISSSSRFNSCNFEYRNFKPRRM